MGTDVLGSDVTRLALHRRGLPSRCTLWTPRCRSKDVQRYRRLANGQQRGVQAASTIQDLPAQEADTADQSAASTSGAPVQAEEKRETDRPGTSSKAIAAGIQALRDGSPEKAIEVFQEALELPGNGVMRFAGTVREYRCPSEGEEQAALYNMACAYAALRQKDSALACLEGALEAGLSDCAAIRSDPDLAPVQGPDLDKLLGKYDGLLAKLLGPRKKKEGDGKFWLGW